MLKFCIHLVLVYMLYITQIYFMGIYKLQISNLQLYCRLPLRRQRGGFNSFLVLKDFSCPSILEFFFSLFREPIEKLAFFFEKN